MAIGLSRLFGVRLPLNFASPYKAANIIEFWRRWHMTLSRFLRDYLYFPLGGNRRGPARRYVNLMTTMILGGLWHGAGWTFVLWGTLHGLYLVLNHGWRELVASPLRLSRSRAYRLAAGTLTFLAVVVAWVPFRAKSIDAAGHLLQAMSGLNGFVLPDRWLAAAPVLQEWGVRATDLGFASFRVQFYVTAALMAIALLAPNTQTLLRRFDPAVDFHSGGSGQASRLAWRPSAAWLAFIGLLLAWSVVRVPQGEQLSKFLYFQF